MSARSVARTSTTGSPRTCIRVTCSVRGTSSTEPEGNVRMEGAAAAAAAFSFPGRYDPFVNMRKTREIAGVAPDAIPYGELLAAGQPAILRGVARDWPLVRHGLESAASAADYLKKFSGARAVVVYAGDAAHGGRFTYNDDFS